MADETPSYAKLREYQRRIAAMLADPECTRELFSLGVSLLDYAVLNLTAPDPVPSPEVVKMPARGRPARTKPRSRKWSYYAERVWGESSYSRYEIRGVLTKDIRRYDAIQDAETTGPGRRCGAPMIRRHGPCGNSGSIRGMLTDPHTGRKQWLAACSRHRDWFNDQVRANRAALGDVHEIGIPAANAGGVLARHIPEIDWVHVWKQLKPDWVAPPESADEPVEVLPRLRLILGGA